MMRQFTSLKSGKRALLFLSYSAIGVAVAFPNQVLAAKMGPTASASVQIRVSVAPQYQLTTNSSSSHKSLAEGFCMTTNSSAPMPALRLLAARLERPTSIDEKAYIEAAQLDIGFIPTCGRSSKTLVGGKSLEKPGSYILVVRPE